jgi:Tfp pilus assembly protein PilF
MHFLLLIPSSLLLGLLFAHSWRYRGKKVTLAFFISCFVFGIIRGNLIDYICIASLGEKGLPYLFVQPVARIWNASLQECLGWIFALYLSWSTVEWILSRQGKNKVPLYRLIGLSGFFMGGIAYAVEAAAGAVKWWVWVLPVKNSFFAEVPPAGIIAWISVVFDFLGPFLFLYYKTFSRWWSKALLCCIFPIHMLMHTKVSFDVDWLPMMGPSDLWHWLIVGLLLWGVVEGGPEISPWTSAARKEKRKNPWLRHGVLATLAGFILVLAIVNFILIDGFWYSVSMIPFVVGALFFSPLYAWIFCLAACALIGLTTGGWSYTIVPLSVAFIFSLGNRRFDEFLSLLWRRRIALLTLLLATIGVYHVCYQRKQRDDVLMQLGLGIMHAENSNEFERLLSRLPSPARAEDAGMYNLLAEQAFHRKNYPAAEWFLHRAIEVDSTDAYVFGNIAIIYSLKKDYGAAIRAYEKSLEINPINFDSYRILGQIYTELDSLEKAEKLYLRALKYARDKNVFTQALENVRNRIDRNL